MRELLNPRVFNAVTIDAGAAVNAERISFNSIFLSSHRDFFFSGSASRMDALPSIRELFMAIYLTAISMISGMAYAWLRLARSWPFCYDEPCSQNTTLPNASVQTLALRDAAYEQLPPSYSMVLMAPVSQAEHLVLIERVKKLEEERERMLSEIKELRLEVPRLKENTKEA